MDTPAILISQYLAALEMLKGAIMQCPASIWDGSADKTRFWHIAYHALFYTHLYLQDSEETFTPWSKHRQGYNSFDLPTHPPEGAPDTRLPYDKESLLKYLDFCQDQVRERVSQLDLNGSSGFYWLPFNKLELQLYNIRQNQQHTGELMERLGTRAGLELDWVGMGRS